MALAAEDLNQTMEFDGTMVYVRKITRTWKNKSGVVKQKDYYYWYKSRRIGDKVISECIGKATKADFDRTHQDLEASADPGLSKTINAKPKVQQIDTEILENLKKKE